MNRIANSCSATADVLEHGGSSTGKCESLPATASCVALCAGQRERAAPDSPLAACAWIPSTRAAIARNAELAERLRWRPRPPVSAFGISIYASAAGFWTEQMYALYGVPIDEAPYDFEQWLEHVHPRDQARMAAAAHRLFVGRRAI